MVSCEGALREGSASGSKEMARWNKEEDSYCGCSRVPCVNDAEAMSTVNAESILAH